MRLHQRLADYTIYISDSGGAPYSESIEGHRLTRKWYKETDAYYNARMNALQPRTLVVPAGANGASLYLPGAPYHRLRLILGNGNYAVQGTCSIAASRRLGDYAQITQYNLPTNNYSINDFDAKTIAGGDYYPTTYRLKLIPTLQDNAELGDLWLYAYADLEPYLQDIIPIRTTYDTSLFAPLTDNALLARTLQTRAYQIALLIPRTEPSLPWLLSLREHEGVELEYNGKYLPCAIQSAESRPAGGALWQIELQAAATAPYAYSTQRYIATYTHSSQGDLHGYELPGSAPAPTEIRLQITATDTTDIEIHFPAAAETITIRPDNTGIWSIHDTGRIYHIPTGTTAQWIDRTDILKSGTLPLILTHGDGLFALKHTTAWGIPSITLAAYPRYMPEEVL